MNEGLTGDPFEDYVRVTAWLQARPALVALLLTASLCVSMKFTVQMWLLHREASVVKRIAWTVILLVPLVGWICYGGFFHVPSTLRDDTNSHDSTVM